MKFSQILGKCNPKLVLESEERLSATFTELAMGYTTRGMGSRLGGDIFLHQLVSPLKQICDARAIEFDEESTKILNSITAADGSKLTDETKEFLIRNLKTRLGEKLLRTAATNGVAFFWAPQFIVKKSQIGLRLVVGHEGIHNMYMHPSRRGPRNPALWNIAVDYKTNFILMDDLRLRKCYRPEEVFREELGDFITLNEYASFIKDPFNPPQKLAQWNPISSMKQMLNPGYSADNKESKSFYYAEPTLSDEMRKPENIYDFILNHIPKCKTCGKIGVWKKPQEYKILEQQLQEQNKIKDEHIHEQ